MWKKIILAGFANLILGLIINYLVTIIAPSLASEYQNLAMFRPWSDPLMMVYFLYPFILAYVLYYLWGKLSKPKAVDFAKLYFVIATIPGMFITYTSFQISLGMVLLWAATSFINVYVAGWIYSK